MDLIEFDTDCFPREDRYAAFLQTLVNLVVDPIGDPLRFSAYVVALPLHPVIVYRNALSPVTCLRHAARAKADSHDHYLISIVVRGGAEGRVGPHHVRCAAGDALLVDHREPMEIVSPDDSVTLVAMLPRAFLSEALPGVHGSHVLPAGASVRAIAMLIEHLLGSAGEVAPESAHYYGRTIRDLIGAAALAAHRIMPPGTQEMLSLLERARLLIDANLATPLTPEAMCQTLGVSRSALYRATRAAGGVQRLIRRRRLQAVHRMLLDPKELRPVSAIAYECGYIDASQFSRDFHKTFEVTARTLRATRSPAMRVTGTRQMRLRRLLIQLAEEDMLPVRSTETPCERSAGRG